MATDTQVIEAARKLGITVEPGNVVDPVYMLIDAVLDAKDREFENAIGTTEEALKLLKQADEHQAARQYRRRDYPESAAYIGYGKYAH